MSAACPLWEKVLVSRSVFATCVSVFGSFIFRVLRFGVCGVCAATHQFVHEIWVRAGGQQLSAGQGLVNKRVVLKGVPKGRLHPTDTGLQCNGVKTENTVICAQTLLENHQKKHNFVLSPSLAVSDVRDWRNVCVSGDGVPPHHPSYLRHRQAQLRAPVGGTSGPSVRSQWWWCDVAWSAQ